MGPRVSYVLAWVAVSAGLVGCARAETAADRHVSEMREAIARMQVDRDRTDQRLGALEVALAEERSRREAAEARPRPPAPPPRVVQLGGDGEPEGEDPNDPSARPEIKLVGSGAPRPVRGKGGRLDATILDDAPDGPRPSALDPQAKRAYDDALALVNSKKYDRALEALAAFLVRWPDHPNAENAMYWRGEVYYAQGEYLRAAEQFDAVLARFGGVNKGPDALLKLGMVHDRLGAPERARGYWNRLRSEYPRSEAARRIPEGAPAGSGPKGPKESR